MDKEAKRQIIQLLTVIFAGLLVAVLVLGAMVYSWSPHGTYLAKNALLSLDVAEQMAVQKINTKTGEKNRVVLDHVEFTYFDPELKQFKTIEVSKNGYAKFYSLVGGDRSLPQVSDAVVKLFSQNPASMIVEVRNKGGGDPTPFQEVDFVADYYRVELHEDNPLGNFAYFHHPQIYQKVMSIAHE